MDNVQLLIISLCFGFSQCFGPNNYYFENHKYCDDLSPYYGDINLDQITGVWYGVEKIPHAKGEYRIEYTKECFYIDIKEVDIMPTSLPPYTLPTNGPYGSRHYGQYGQSGQYGQYGQYNQYANEPYRIRHLVLEWHEGLWKEEYHIKVNTSHRGFWPTDVPNGSVDEMYRFFGGVIQVLKAANNHLVLNFCMRLPHSQLYSVVLSRNENQLTPEDLASIHNVFTMKHLSTSALKRVCENSAPIMSMSSLSFLLVAVILWRSQ
ncbi:uncharacterized protein LOC128670242 isoform X1 [Plodia interpunctella]|uniref:uncharacterized protein LOC128670242 isoform X1 n=1 Tax=Plodia interpunctella TaxID=58824 RepID=UPI002368A273|nr:uncharacterized protein LOC128670242 isoform X1 [Plodia interpunctella]